MDLGKMASDMRDTLTKTYNGVVRYAKLERVLATLCLFIPVILMWRDNWAIRDSISAYYNMTEGQAFYVPLTVAAMLFIVNGVVKEKRVYNTILGIMLAGLVIFNHTDAKILHFTFATLFFVGNAIVILVFSSKKERWFKALMVFVICFSMLGWFAFKWYSVFWAEWISFAIIALHYVLESYGVID